MSTGLSVARSQRDEHNDLFAELLPRQIKRPSLSSARSGPLYYQAPPQLEQATRPNLEKTCGELLEEGDEITVTDAGLPFQLTLLIRFT